VTGLNLSCKGLVELTGRKTGWRHKTAVEHSGDMDAVAGSSASTAASSLLGR
jgi:hypothetical protein